MCRSPRYTVSIFIYRYRIVSSVSVSKTSIWTLRRYTNVVLLGRVALVAQRPIVVKLSRGRSVSVGLYVRASVGLSSALWQNGGSDQDAVWHHRSDGSRDEAGSGVWGSVHGKGYFVLGANLGRAIVTNGGFTAYVHVRQHHDAALFPNYFGQTCYVSS